MLNIGGGMTVKTTLTLWERLPLVPNTTTVKPLPPPPNELTLIVRMAVAVPPGVSVTLEGLTDQVLQAGGQIISGPVFVVRETVPANPLMLVTLMLEVMLKKRPVVGAVVTNPRATAATLTRPVVEFTVFCTT